MDQQRDIALRRDSDEDWRARIAFHVTSVTPFTPSLPSWPDPITSVTDYTALGRHGYRLVLVDGLLGTYAPAPRALGLTDHGIAFTALDWNNWVNSAIIHEFGHQFNLSHPAITETKRIMHEVAVPGAVELLQNEADAYETYRPKRFPF